MQAPPMTRARSSGRRAPASRIFAMSCSIAAGPKRAEDAAEPLAIGSMKWFIPPMPRCGSHRQTATQEPRIVVIAAGTAETSNCPGWR